MDNRFAEFLFVAWTLFVFGLTFALVGLSGDVYPDEHRLKEEVCNTHCLAVETNRGAVTEDGNCICGPPTYPNNRRFREGTDSQGSK